MLRNPSASSITPRIRQPSLRYAFCKVESSSIPAMHDWTMSAALMAKVLAEKGYHYQYLFVRNAKHGAGTGST